MQWFVLGFVNVVLTILFLIRMCRSFSLFLYFAAPNFSVTYCVISFRVLFIDIFIYFRVFNDYVIIVTLFIDCVIFRISFHLIHHIISISVNACPVTSRAISSMLSYYFSSTASYYFYFRHFVISF